MHINNALCCNLVGKILHKNKVKKFQVQQKLWAEILVILFYLLENILNCTPFEMLKQIAVPILQRPFMLIYSSWKCPYQCNRLVYTKDLVK